MIMEESQIQIYVYLYAYHICVYSFHMCYIRFGAYLNHMHIKIIVKKQLIKKNKRKTAQIRD
jgi:hypothetical protein